MLRGRPQDLFPCKYGCHVYTTSKCWRHRRPELTVGIQAIQDQFGTHLELTCPNFPRRIVYKTFGEIPWERSKWEFAKLVTSNLTLHTTNQIMIFGVCSFTVKHSGSRQSVSNPYVRDDTKSMVFHHHGATDTGKQSLLHTTLKTKDRNFRRWLVDTVNLGGRSYRFTHKFYVNCDFSGTNPRKDNAVSVLSGYVNLSEQDTDKRVTPMVYQNACWRTT